MFVCILHRSDYTPEPIFRMECHYFCNNGTDDIGYINFIKSTQVLVIFVLRLLWTVPLYTCKCESSERCVLSFNIINKRILVIEATVKSFYERSQYKTNLKAI